MRETQTILFSLFQIFLLGAGVFFIKVIRRKKYDTTAKSKFKAPVKKVQGLFFERRLFLSSSRRYNGL